VKTGPSCNNEKALKPLIYLLSVLKGGFIFYLYFCGDEPQNVSKWMRLFSIYIEGKEKLGKKSNSLHFFNLKVVFELFHPLFRSSEVLRLL